MKSARKTFTIEQKESAVRSILSGSKSRADIKQELGVKKTGTITIWINNYLNKRKEPVEKEKGEYKVCNKCGRNLPVSEYWINKTASDGLQNFCIDCMKSYQSKSNSVVVNKNKSIKDELNDLQNLYNRLLVKIESIEKAIG